MMSGRSPLQEAVAALCMLLASCSTPEPRNWAFVQAVGGVRVGPPLISEVGGWALRVVADVSGTRMVTVKPTTLNSGLACDAAAVVEGQSILVTISTVPAGGSRMASCSFVLLGELPSGRYPVFYKGPGEPPVPLGQVEIGR